MTLRCPKCGSKRVIFLSTTDGTAVGSTDQRYLCKDCQYRGSLILDDSPTRKKSKPAKSIKPFNLLLILNLLLFVLVQAVFFLNQLQTAVGIAILLAWIAVFLLTVLSLSGKFSEGSTEWYQQGLTLMTGIIVAMVIGFILGYDLYGILLLAPFGIMAAFIFSWLFVDRSEDYMNKDLERLQKEIK